MAPCSLAVCMVMALMVALAPGAVDGSSRRLFGQTNGAVAAPAYGICSSVVAVHGYKCQEIDVSTSLIRLSSRNLAHIYVVEENK